MATADVQHSNTIEPGSVNIAAAELPSISAKPNAEDLEIIVIKWVDRFNEIIASGELSRLCDLFWAKPSPGFWRDHLGLSWDFRTLHGPDDIVAFLQKNEGGCRIKKFDLDGTSPFKRPTIAPVDGKGQTNCLQSFLSFTSDIGKGRGIIRLLPDTYGKWKAFTLYTKLDELTGHEEAVLTRRPLGVDHGDKAGRKNWREKRSVLENFEDGLEPTVLIVGCGQGGLTAAARLKQLGIESLIVDQHERVGDNWRKRYHQLVLHDPVWYDHLPYVPFPATWPVFTPKDKLGDWFESYVKTMELNVWNSSSIKSAIWDAKAKSWAVTVTRRQNDAEDTRVIKPRHVIQATGHSGEMKFPSSIKGVDSFKGDTLVHSSQHRGAKPNGDGKRAVVVGCCNSGHDIAQDYYENGYDVTIVQRSSTSIVTSDSVVNVLLQPLYGEGGPPTEDADILLQSIPSPVLKSMHLDITAAISEREAPLRQGLQAAGFSIDNGPDGSGFFMKYLTRGGGYYIDVGASQLIIDRKIKIKQGQEISSVNAHSITFADGDELPADEIVFATGYQNMKGTARKIFGDAVADKLNDVWGFDEEGEIRTMWRRSGHDNFWFFGGNLALCRYYSQLLALQIKALEEGLTNYDSL